MVYATLESPPVAPRALSLRQLAAVLAGNALEFYDFLTFSFFTVQIGHTFFPGQDEDTRILSTLAIFGAGFLARPLGAYVIGRWGDRAGRKPAMFLSFALMGIAIVGLVLTPAWAAIGIAAPVLFLLFRLLQGFALGGEVGPTKAYLLEIAPPERRGFFVSLQFMTQDLAVLAAGIVGEILSTYLSPDALDNWGWRIAFLIGASVVPFGLVVRRSLPETFSHPRPEKTRTRTPGLWRLALLGGVMLATVTITNYTIDYMTTFAENTLEISARVAFGATVMIGFWATAFDLVSGVLTDRYGRKPIMIGAGFAFLVLVLPIFYAVISLRSTAALLIGSALLGTLQGLYAPPILIGVTEGLPREIRSGALALIYAIAISTFGGSTQFIVKGLIKLTGNPYSPAIFMTGALAVAVVAMFFVRETAPVKTRTRL